MVRWRSVVFEVFLWCAEGLTFTTCALSGRLCICIMFWGRLYQIGYAQAGPHNSQAHKHKHKRPVTKWVRLYFVSGEKLAVVVTDCFPSHNDYTCNTCIWVDKITYSPCRILFSWETLARVLDCKTRPRRSVELDPRRADKPHDASN